MTVIWIPSFVQTVWRSLGSSALAERAAVERIVCRRISIVTAPPPGWAARSRRRTWSARRQRTWGRGQMRRRWGGRRFSDDGWWTAAAEEAWEAPGNGRRWHHTCGGCRRRRREMGRGSGGRGGLHRQRGGTRPSERTASAAPDQGLIAGSRKVARIGSGWVWNWVAEGLSRKVWRLSSIFLQTARAHLRCVSYRSNGWNW